MNVKPMIAVVAVLLAATAATAAEPTGHSHDGEQHASRSLEVSGMVRKPMTLTVDALRALPATEFGETPIFCGRAEPKHVVEGFRGVLLRDLLVAAEVIDDDVRHSSNYMYVVADATDDYKVVFSLHEIRNTAVGDGILVFYEKNGVPLNTGEGLIALISLADANRCNRHVRWLNRIEVRRLGEGAN